MITFIAQDTDSQMLEVKTNGVYMLVDSKIGSKWVDLTLEQYHNEITIHLDDEAIKALISHLQRQIQ